MSGIFIYFAQRRALYEPALAHYPHLIGQPLRLIGALGGINYPAAYLPRRRAQTVEKPLALSERERAKRFVEQQKVGLAHKSARQNYLRQIKRRQPLDLFAQNILRARKPRGKGEPLPHIFLARPAQFERL